MFSFSSNLLSGQHDTQKARSPPSKPTPVTFPCLRPPVPSSTSLPPSWTKAATGVTAQVLRLKKPSDVTNDTLASLNVTFQPECDFKSLLLSLSDNACLHLPPPSWLDLSTQDQPSQVILENSDLPVLSNGRASPEQKEFYARVRELYFANRDAFSTLSRKANGSQAPLRLAHFRKFWEGLDNLAYYWDTSLDIYNPPPGEEAKAGATMDQADVAGAENSRKQDTLGATDESKPESGFASLPDDEPRKKAKTEPTSDKPVSPSTSTNGFGVVSARTPSYSSSQVLPARIAPSKVYRGTKTDDQALPPDLMHGSYSGYRIGNGAEMPDQYRIDCVRAFVEPIAWAFGVTLSPHRRPPVLTLGSVRFPVRMSSVAWRGPQDRVRARQGWVEGPVFGIQCRADVNFGKSGNLEAESVLDVVRELGGMLLLAQERAREGHTESRAGDGKWWTTKERWGGGPGGEIGEPVVATDTTAKKSTARSDETVERNRDGSRLRRKTTPLEVWKTLKVGNPLWDPKATYEAIGRNKSDEWDDVFMISSLNHHISVLHLHIHPLYLLYITEEKLPDTLPSDAAWCSPKLQRTRWFNLFSIEDRTEAMRGIWGLISYLMRANDSARETAKSEGLGSTPV